MKTLKRGFVLRALSVVLTLMMILSLCTVGIVSSSAADVDLAETSTSVNTIYLNTGGSSLWDQGGAWFVAWVWKTGGNGWAITGTEVEDGIYSFTHSNSFENVIFIRMTDSATVFNWSDDGCYWNRTDGDLAIGTDNCYKITGWINNSKNCTGEWTSYSASVASFFADVDGDATTTTDRINPVGNKLYLPSANVILFASEGSFTIGDYTVTTEGTEVDLASGTYTLSGDASGTIEVLRSSNISSIHTITEVAVPQGTNQGYDHKDDYETKGSIVVYSPDGTQKNSDTVLKKIKGRGNSSWEASNEIIGKYAFNITLDKKAKLLDESEKAKKYCLVSYNADEARMRNMVVYELAQQIGVKYVADYEPIDFYNNGEYIGSYLLTDKVEIGDPLVDIVNLDDINELLGTVDEDNGPWGTNYDLYDDDSQMVRAASNGNLSDTSTKGYYKYISNLEEPDASEYADSGFLLEFELNERFADEISGFISTKGQQIVCKYPEYATENEIKFIMNKWNTAEALMYNESATYAELDAVIDVESFAKMYLIQELTKNLDAGATSYYVFYHGGKLHAGVAWDYDWTLGQYIQSGDSNKSVANQTSGRFDSDANETLDKSEGWWANSREIYPNTNVLNAQAALCQNDAFWSVVTAEWNENFYHKAIGFADSTVSSVSELDGNMLEFYNLVSASTAMDEDKWGLIASNPLSGWGSKDTGSTHNAAVVWLNNWMYERISWMDKYLNPDNTNHPNTAPFNVDYSIQPPTVSVDKESYTAGETVTLTIEDKTDGDYYYKIFRNGTMWQTASDNTYTFTTDIKGATEYTIYAVSENSGKSSAVSNVAVVNVEGFNFSMDVTAPESVMVGNSLIIDATTNSTETVTYTLKDSEDNIVDTNTTGDFSYMMTTDDIGTKNYTLEAVTTVDGEVFTATEDITIQVNEFTFSVKLTAPASVEAGMDITLNASAVSNSAVTYKFYTADGTPVAENNSSVYSVSTTQEDIGTSKGFYVVATTTVAGTTYTATSDVVETEITEVKETYDVTIYFKSTSSLAYRPILTTNGAINDLTDYSMIKDLVLESTGKNSSQSATYYWYRADVTVSKASPSLSISVLSSRYAMEGDITLTITASGPVYLGVDNLNSGSEMVNMTDWPEAERNWTQSALHMVYDSEIDSDSLASVSAYINLANVGDANGDGMINIKDATLIQKFLANLQSLSTFSMHTSDVNNDGRVTIKDATAIQKKIAGCL